MENLSDIRWLGHASFWFLDENGNKIYFIDPYNLAEKITDTADVIFITHAHPDHFSPNDIARIAKPNTSFIAPPDIVNSLSSLTGEKINVSPNNEYDVNGFKFKTIPAYNIKENKLNFHPKANNWVGYIFNLNGKKIYHAGDTDFTDEMKNLSQEKLDIAMLPMDGIYTMDVEEAALAANKISAKITIPIHYRAQNPENYKELEDKFKNLVKDSKVIILEEFR